MLGLRVSSAQGLNLPGRGLGASKALPLAPRRSAQNAFFLCPQLHTPSPNARARCTKPGTQRRLAQY